MSLINALLRIEAVKKSNSTVLNLHNLELTEIPEQLSQLTQIIHLDLSNNKLSTTSGLEKLSQLVHLDLSNNRLSTTTGLEELSQLNYLDLAHNRLTEIECTESFNKLRKLDLSHNLLSTIKGIRNLSELKNFRLNNNVLTDINDLHGLSQLTELSLNGNRLSQIKNVERLERLARLDLRDNQLTEIPENLLNMGLSVLWKLTHEHQGIYIEGNPLTSPPPEIIKQGNVAIREYYSQRKKSGEVLLHEVKLILLGDGRSGKTSFANRLLGKELPKESDRTQGIDIVIGQYSFPLADGMDFKINIWDFAGQDKYKTLHQLFYTESSLYVMVAESGSATIDYDDWFQTAELFGEGSPLVLILNEFKTGIGMSSFDSKYWKMQFPELLKEVLTVNLGTKRNFHTAERYIQLIAQTLPHTKYAFPANWAAIRRVLHDRRNEQYITLTEYLKICNDNNLPEKEGALLLSSVLHKIGDCLHYQKSELLRQFIILKNEWATDAVYKILDDKTVAEERCGFFDFSDISRIWNTTEYEEMRPQLLELMKQFKLAYQLPGKPEFVTPLLLPPASPAPETFSWPSGDSLELYIEYDFLPKALMTQFIVTRHADIAKERTLVWRHGVVLKWEDEALAEISKTKLQGRDAFHIRTQGNNRKGMMTVILKTFRELHDDYKGIKCREKVPCICEGCKSGSNRQHYFDFGNLQFRLENRRFEVECDNSLNRVNVLKLLENIFVFEKFEQGKSLRLKDTRILKLFLACSNELINEREKVEQALNRKNRVLREKGVSIEPLIWEDAKHISTTLRSQHDYNLDIEQCDVFVMLFYSKVGKYCLEEFRLATSLFESRGMPRIRIFQKDIDLPKSLSKTDADSRYEFIEELKKLQHFPILFENSDKLINEIERIIDNLLLDNNFLKQLKFE